MSRLLRTRLAAFLWGLYESFRWGRRTIRPVDHDWNSAYATGFDLALWLKGDIAP